MDPSFVLGLLTHSQKLLHYVCGVGMDKPVQFKFHNNISSLLQDGYYNKTSGNPNGCVACQCETGAPVNSTCDKATGQCHCLPHISGKNCDQPDAGYFVPKLDYMTHEAEYALNAGVSKIVIW